jgi:ATP adenylyltransferase
MEYIEGQGAGNGCIFCNAFRQAEGDCLVIWRDSSTLVMLNRFPYTSGHLMVVPNEHVDTLEKLSDTALMGIMRQSKRALGALRAAYNPSAFNIGMNIGTAAGAGVADHVHLHIVPRWPGDTNFMSTLGDVRVLPECLEDTWRRLRDAFAKLP